MLTTFFAKQAPKIAPLLLTVFLVGCGGARPAPPVSSNNCIINPSSCMYEGSYELNEREFAEQEARRLNRESANRLRRQSIWWW